MKRFVAMILMMILCLSCLPLASAADIVSNKGLTVLSPEQYLGIEPCDTISTQDNWYKYQYTNRGLPWYSYGTSNSVDWRRMEKYVNALVDSGYYVVLEHAHPNPEEEYWCLGYVGPGSVTKTFGANGNTSRRRRSSSSPTWAISACISALTSPSMILTKPRSAWERTSLTIPRTAGEAAAAAASPRACPAAATAVTAPAAAWATIAEPTAPSTTAAALPAIAPPAAATVRDNQHIHCALFLLKGALFA